MTWSLPNDTGSQTYTDTKTYRNKYTIRAPSLHRASQARLEALHWLPVWHRIVFKVAVLTYKTLHTQKPAHLHRLLNLYRPSHTLRSVSHHILQILLLNTNFGWRSFSYASAETRNKLPGAVNSFPSQHSKLALTPTCLTCSVNSRHDCLLATWWLQAPQIWFFRPHVRYKFSFYYYYYYFTCMHATSRYCFWRCVSVCPHKISKTSYRKLTQCGKNMPNGER